MTRYQAILSRGYLVTIDAKDEDSAARLVESFIGEEDLSTLQDREEYKFEIREIELGHNDVVEIYPIKDTD